MSRDIYTTEDHEAAVRADLGRIADALERIAAALAPQRIEAQQMVGPEDDLTMLRDQYGTISKWARP